LSKSFKKVVEKLSKILSHLEKTNGAIVEKVRWCNSYEVNGKNKKNKNKNKKNKNKKKKKIIGIP
jgi:hypothetical protein